MSKNRSLTKIISALCACATVAGGVSSAEEHKNTNLKTGNRSTVSSVNKKSRFGNIIDYIKQNPGKSAAMGLGIAGGVGAAGFGAKKLYDHYKSDAKKPVANSDAGAAVSNTQVSDVAVSNESVSNTSTNQVNTPQYTPQYQMKTAGDIRIKSGVDVKNNGKIWIRRSFGEAQNSRFESRDKEYIAPKLYSMGFKDAGLKLNANNCTVFDLNNKNYSLYLFDFSAEIPLGAKDFVKRIDGTNLCYALGKGNFWKGSELVKPTDYNLTITGSSDQSFDYSMYIDADKL